jgi:hypothetical protein
VERLSSACGKTQGEGAGGFLAVAPPVVWGWQEQEVSWRVAMPMWAGYVVGSLLAGAGSVVLGLATAAWRLVGAIPGYGGVGLLSAAALAAALMATRVWLDGQLAVLEEVWLWEQRRG